LPTTGEAISVEILDCAARLRLHPDSVDEITALALFTRYARLAGR
jgi:hypothetical protein